MATASNTRMDRVLGVIQAGGAGSRLDVLTRETAKPALPFGGEFHLIDFAMSTMAHSCVPHVWVDVQYQGHTLTPLLAGGRPWDLDRTLGGFQLLTHVQGPAPVASGFAKGNADSLVKIRNQIQLLDPELVVVVSADHVFRLDLRDVIDQHRKRGAECTLVTVDVSLEEAASKAELEIAADGTVRTVVYKPQSPQYPTVSAEITVYDAAVLDQALQELSLALDAEASGEESGEDSNLGDYGETLLPWFVQRGATHGFPMSGYWRDVGQPEAYLGAHRDLLAGRIDVFDGPSPIRGLRIAQPAAYLEAGSEISGSAISSGAVVRGRVVGSVLGPGVTVEAGAEVHDSVLMDGVTVRRGARIHSTIIAEQCEIGQDAVVGAQPAGTRPRPDDLVLIGRQSHVSGGTVLPAGSRLEPGTTA